MRRALLYAFGAALVACPPKEDVTPQIPISPGAAQRVALIPSRSGREARAAKEKPARVHPLAKGDELGGSSAVGRPGDIVLENDEVVFVIDQLGGGVGFAESGGNVVDAADARTRKDELGMVFTYFGTFPRQGVYGRLTSGTQDGAAWVEARGRELYEKDLEVVTRYTLRPGDRALLLETTLTNKSDHPVDKLGFGDAIQWGGAEKTAPGKPLGFRGRSSGPYIGGIGRSVSYAITSTEGEIAAISGGSWTDTEQKADVTIKPGESVQYARVFLVGARPDSSSLVGELVLASAGELGQLEVQLVEGDKPVPSFPGAKVSIFAPGGGEVLTLASAVDEPLLAGDLPPGKYELAYASGGGRAAAGARVPVEIGANKGAKVAIPVTRPGHITLGCRELAIGDDGRQNRVPSPCKVTIDGVNGTASPDFGPAHAAGPARNQVTTFDGKVDVPLAVGAYRVTVSRGPEYDTRTVAATIRAGETWSPPGADDALMSRVVDTSGYVSTDFHQHTMLGADAPVSLADRVIGNAAEGLEIAVASEHNIVADLSGMVRQMHLEPALVQISGDELTTDSSKKPWGHANVFPLPYEPEKPNGGAPLVRDRSARDLFAEIRARHLSPAPIFQINHPRTKITGYFDQTGFDPKTGVGTDPGYDPDFDALEVWNGRNVDSRDKVIADFFALLRTKHPVTATADTDTHGVVGQEAGYPRTFVRVDADRHLEDWSTARTEDLVRGVRERRDVVLTNGPFLRVTANDAPIGGVAKGGNVTLKIHVEHAPWLKVDRVRIVSAMTGADMWSAPLKVAPLRSGAVGADVTQAVRFATDGALVVIVDGATPMTPVLSGESKEIAPFAMTGAIWVDADGDGQALGRRAMNAAWPKAPPSSPTPAAAPAKKP